MSAVGAKGEVTVLEPSAAERTVARRAAESRATVPTLELSVGVSSPPTTPRLVRACALALREHPRANGAYRDGRFELYSRINIGLVISDGDAYVIPSLFDADRKAPVELAQEIDHLLHDVGRIASSAYAGATFTVWNAGAHGLSSAAIPVVPPQAAALAAGTSTLTLSCDHRILYGAGAAEFLQAIARHLDGDGV